MAMAYDELYKITPRSLFNKLYGFRHHQREAWERTRLQCYYTVLPYLPEEYRNKDITDFMPFAWDKEHVDQNIDKIREKSKELAKQRKALWKKIDGVG